LKKAPLREWFLTGLVSRYRTEEYGKVARIQLFITNPTTPGPLVTSTTVAQLPAGLSTGKSFYGGLAVTAGAIADNIMFPVSIDAGAVTVLCIGTKLEMDSDAAMSIDMTYPLD
jgi:hypothetical protein